MKVQIVNMTEIQLRIQFFSIFRSDGIWFMRNTIFPEKITYHQYVSNKITNERCKLSTPNDEYQRKSLTINMYLIKLLMKGAS